MRRLTTTVAVALLLAGCGSGESPTAVPLLTGNLGCYAGGESGPTALLVADPTYGTSLNGQPVMWPGGYTARRAGSQVEVLDAAGTVRATTGRTYHISFAYAPGLTPNDDGSVDSVGPARAFPAAADCGYAWDFIDCTATPADRYCKP
jgi:hypothetical protein